MYKIKPLNYNYDDLSPTISADSLKYHYEVLYRTYVDNYNKALEKLEQARKNNKYDDIKALEKNLTFQGAGALLHTLYFENLEKYPSAISKEVAEAINSAFTSFDQFKNQFINNLINIEGSGWGILGFSKSLNKLIILQAEKHQNGTLWDFTPILVIDIWEHAYYLDYQTDKKDYATKIFDIINWEVVNRRYAIAVRE